MVPCFRCTEMNSGARGDASVHPFTIDSDCVVETNQLELESFRMWSSRRTYTNDRGLKWTGIATSVASAAVVGTSSFFIYQLVKAHGWAGTLRYIWEGDPEPRHLRDRVRTLRLVEKKLQRIEKAISSLEEGLERARLDSVDGSEASHINDLWLSTIPDKDLRQKLALISYDLDQHAAKIDHVSAGDVDGIKARKKTLSTLSVMLMERADALISVYKEEQ